MGLRVCTVALNKDGHYVKVGEVRDSTSEAVVKYAANFAAEDAELDALVAGAPSTAYTQTYSTAARTVPDATVAAVATTAATNSSPYGYAGSAQADAIPVAINALAADVLALKKVITAIIDDLQTMGLFA